MDHFAKPDDELAVAQREKKLQRNFQGYSTRAGSEIMGFGLSAVSQTPSSYRQNHKVLEKYYAALDRGEIPVNRGLEITAEDKRRQEVIMRIMCYQRLDFAELSGRFGFDFASRYAEELGRTGPLASDGLVEVSGPGLLVTDLGRLFLRNIATCFDAHFEAGAGSPRPGRVNNGASTSGDPHPVAVLGAGITGLTAAWRLKAAGVPFALFEASDRVGGVIGSIREEGWLREIGPNSLIEGSSQAAALIEGVGLGSRRVFAPKGKRYVVRSGRPVAMPESPASLVTSRLFSARAKLRLLGEPFRPPHSGPDDESVADFVIRRLGREFLDYAVNPFVGGVYAGDPRRLSVRHGFGKLHALEQRYGSLIKGAIAMRNASAGPRGRIFSFQDGLEELPRAIAAALGESIRLRSRVTALRPRGGQWDVVVDKGGIEEAGCFSAVISALPANALAALSVEGITGMCGPQTLGEIEQPPVVSVFTGYRAGDVGHALDGFGVLLPEVERFNILGTLFSSSLFPGRAPGGHVALTTFIGGTRHPDAIHITDSEILELVAMDLRSLLGVRADPAFARIRRWPHAIPQYNVGFARFKLACAAIETEAPGFLIGGNARDGISLANCIESGFRLADAAAQAASR